MNSLQTELHRLYFDAEPSPPGKVRAMVIELAGPPSWKVLSKVWQGVQAELELPAPGIAVSGTDGLQLWFSLARPVAPAQAHAFLAMLQARFLPDVEPGRIRLMPSADGSSVARMVPALQGDTGNWSAFLAPDLAPVFADTPWLDIPPNDEGQAALLRALDVIEPAAFDASVRRPEPAAMPSAGRALPANARQDEEPRRFLLGVMNDETVALALRIEAAKALLD